MNVGVTYVAEVWNVNVHGCVQHGNAERELLLELLNRKE